MAARREASIQARLDHPAIVPVYELGTDTLHAGVFSSNQSQQLPIGPGFRVDLHHKDLGILMSVAREAGVVIPLGSVVTQLMGALVAQGHGGLDNGALLQLVEQLSGRDQPPSKE